MTSGIRVGTPAATTHGLREAEMELVASFIAEAVANIGNDLKLEAIKVQVNEMMKKFPLYIHRLK